MYLVGFVIWTHIRWDRMELDETARMAEMIIELPRFAHVIVLALKQEGLGLIRSAANAFKIYGVHLVDETDGNSNCQSVR